jgi:hypothetical protein
MSTASPSTCIYTRVPVNVPSAFCIIRRSSIEPGVVTSLSVQNALSRSSGQIHTRLSTPSRMQMSRRTSLGSDRPMGSANWCPSLPPAPSASNRNLESPTPPLPSAAESHMGLPMVCGQASSRPPCHLPHLSHPPISHNPQDAVGRHLFLPTTRVW